MYDVVLAKLYAGLDCTRVIGECLMCQARINRHAERFHQLFLILLFFQLHGVLVIKFKMLIKYTLAIILLLIQNLSIGHTFFNPFLRGKVRFNVRGYFIARFLSKKI